MQTLSPPSRSTSKSPAYHYSMPQASYACSSMDKDSVVYDATAGHSQSHTPVIPPFSDQRFPPADSMLFGGGSAESHSTRSRGSTHNVSSSSCRPQLQVSHPAHHYSTHIRAVNNNRMVDDEQKHQIERVRWQCAPTPEYQHIELSQPLHETPTYIYSYSEVDEYDFEKNGPPATPGYVGSSLPELDTSTSYLPPYGGDQMATMDIDVNLLAGATIDRASLGCEGSDLRQREAYAAGRVRPVLQLPSPSPSPCHKLFKPLSVSSGTTGSRERYLSPEIEMTWGR